MILSPIVMEHIKRLVINHVSAYSKSAKIRIMRNDARIRKRKNADISYPGIVVSSRMTNELSADTRQDINFRLPETTNGVHFAHITKKIQTFSEIRENDETKTQYVQNQNKIRSNGRGEFGVYQ